MTSVPSRDPASLPPPLRFLAGGGRATRLILERDWSSHPLGEPTRWPDTLKSNLSTVLNSPESMFLAWGKEDLSFFFNETYIPLLGPRLSWAMGAPFRHVWADAWEQAEPIIGEAFAGRSKRFTDLPWKLGTDRGPANTWFTFSYSRILDSQGEIAGLFVFTNETTKRVLADAALRQSEERLRLVIEGAKDHVIFTTDPGGIITTWSAGAAAVLGWSPDEAIGRSASMIFTPADRSRGADVREIVGAAREGRAVDERWHLRKDGTHVFLNGSVHPLPVDAQGQERGFIKIARDETARWQAQKDLEQLNATLEQQVAERTADRNRLWQLSSDVMLIADFDGTIEAVNPAWTRILGWTEGELLGRALFSFIHPDDLDHTIAGAAGIAAGQAFARFDNRYRHKDGSYRDIVWAAGPGDGKVIAVGRDATEEKAAASALAVAEEQLRQSQKMEAVGQLTGGLAHDFNNLLTGITGGLDMLKRRIDQGRTDGIERYMQAAQSAAERAAALTHRLLAFSRRQTLEPKPTDVTRLVTGMRDLIERTVGPEIAVEVRDEPQLWPILVDPSQLENALLNLCINARDAMPGGGRIAIETENKHLDETAADNRDLKPGDYVSLSVSDTGSGMPPEVIARVFDPFFTTKPIGMGTGLGLSMVYGFVRQSNGQVRIHSQVGVGTTMRLLLPRHSGDVDTEAATLRPEALRAGAGETVLVVDDEPTVRMLVVEVLEDLGYQAIEAPDGAGGLKILRSGARIDLLVTDVGLPGGMNGRQLADAGRVLRPDLKVLFITGYAEAAVLGYGSLEEGMHVMTKPFAMDGLASRIRGLLPP